MERQTRAQQAAKDAFGRVGLRWVYRFAVDTGAFNRQGIIPIHAVYETAAYDVLSYISLTNGMAQ